MPHIPGHRSQYIILGTNEPYSGRVIMIAGDPFTTVDGGIEGDNQRLELVGENDDLGLDDFDLSLPTPSRLTNQNNSTRDDLGLDDFDANKPPTPMSNTLNPVTRTFVSRVVYYTRNGSQVPVGSELHQHRNGTIMLGHNPNNMGQVVTRNIIRGENDDLGLDDYDPNRIIPPRRGNRRTSRRTGGIGNRRNTNRGSGGGGGGY